jgi:ATP-dependent RNA helicase SUPV3L1/SUV3
MLEVPRYVAMLGNHFEFRDMSELDRITQFVDGRGGGRHHRELTLAEKQMLMTAPIPWRDPECMDIIKMFLGMYRMSLSVDVRKSLLHTRHMETLNFVENKMEKDGRGGSTTTAETLRDLETLHRVLGLYLWLSYRNPVTYADYDTVYELKKRVEHALDWSLRGAPRTRPHRHQQEERKTEWVTGLRWVSGRKIKEAEESGERRQYVKLPLLSGRAVAATSSSSS